MNERRLNESQDDEVTIDLQEVFYVCRKKIFSILLIALIGCGLAFGISSYVITPLYESTSMIYVIGKETTLTSLADLNFGSQLTSDYKVFVTSITVMDNVIDEQNLDMDYVELRRKIDIENPPDTRILKITVKDEDPKAAKDITDSIAKNASEYIADVMEINPPKTVEKGEIPIRQTSPNVFKNTIIGGIAGLLLAIAAIVINIVNDDTVKTDSDVEKLFDVPVIATIPDIEQLNGGIGKKAIRKEEKIQRNDKKIIKFLIIILFVIATFIVYLLKA